MARGQGGGGGGVVRGGIEAWDTLLLQYKMYRSHNLCIRWGGFSSTLSMCLDAHYGLVVRECNHGRKCCSRCDKSDGLARKFRISFLSTKSRFLRGLPSNETPEEVTNQLFSVDSPVAWSWSTLSVRVMSCLPNSGGSGDRIDLARFAERF